MTVPAPEVHAERGLVAAVLPAEVASAELFGDSPETYLPGEEEAVARAVPKRRREFSSVRHCARLAMATLGHPPTPLLRGERGAPVWPAGLVGSLTHCDGYRAAAVAPANAVRSIGIDAEPAAPLPGGVLDVVSFPDEIGGLLRSQVPCSDRLLFCAKESVYKAWFPLMRRWLDFDEARVDIHGDGTFDAHVLQTPSDVDAAGLRRLTGRWTVDRGIVLTAVVVPGED